MRRRTLTLLLGLGAGIAGIVIKGVQPPEAPETFTAAKGVAAGIHAARPTTFYCGCRYQGSEVDLASCGYRKHGSSGRAERLEWEHVVPAWMIGHQRACWKSGGRKNCSANDPAFARAEADLHNLVPSIGELNGDRSNHALGFLNSESSRYGACPMVIDRQRKLAMPPKAARGAAARIYLYMADQYRLDLPARDRRTYETWSRTYPVSEWERWRDQQVGCAMGHGNPYVGSFDPEQCPSDIWPRIRELLVGTLKRLL